jgi:membrane-associated phospholipid phosphatase
MSPVERFDEWADGYLERLRGNPVADKVFMSASHLGDWSLIWHLVGLTRAMRSRRHVGEALQLSAYLGVESLIVNQGIKRLFRRQRPTESGDDRFHVRKPSTSSFPSGHASAGFFAATVLTSMSGKKAAPLWFGLAGIVATSRPYVRIHHASDIVGGAVTGLVLGNIAVAGRRAVLRSSRFAR